ncbi:unnamed protein product [Urochloa decumbens]|uniref:Uncharacterized protein n=1 Tax=Urochloa decumbens TaxID=240449 RepID=A0ABC9BJ21_9POAL
MALNFLWRGLPSPNNQPAGDLDTAKSAILVGVLNGVASTSSYLQLCLSGGGAAGAGYGLYQFASYLTAMLGVALLAVHMALSATVAGSPEWEPVVKWMVWIAKVLTGGTLQFGLGVLHCCLRMWARLMLATFCRTLPLF